MTKRADKVASLIHKQVARLILDLELPGMVTVSKVELSEDLRHAKVFISIFPSDEATENQVLETLTFHIYELQGSLNKKLRMKIFPRLKFVVDYSSSAVQHISRLLKDAKQ